MGTEKPRIIIADTDMNYIVPLQMKFVVDFMDRIDLEIITDKEYFKQLFSFPQEAEILIVSEELYEPALQRHNINNVFLMTEQYEEEQTSELNVNRIFKYTSIKEIFNEIKGKSAEALQIDMSAKKDPQIVFITSASGGVGKTTLALGLSACLTVNYKRVLYINAGKLQSFQRIFENSAPVSDIGIYECLSEKTDLSFSEISHIIRKETFSYFPPFRGSLMASGLQYEVYKKIALAAKKSCNYDFIIVDGLSGFDEDIASLIDIADRVIIVTEQTEASVYATDLLAASVNGSNTDKYIYICNGFDTLRDNALISPKYNLRFAVTDYVEYIAHCDDMKIKDFMTEKDIQRVAYLFL